MLQKWEKATKIDRGPTSERFRGENLVLFGQNIDLTSVPQCPKCFKWKGAESWRYGWRYGGYQPLAGNICCDTLGAEERPVERQNQRRWLLSRPSCVHEEMGDLGLRRIVVKGINDVVMMQCLLLLQAI